jgi:protein-S-isoprenylcysteine O-methyltransferase Ste14
MQPLFAQNPLFRDVPLAGYVIWAVMEVILGIRQLILLVEERVLQEHLGQRYQEYMRRTKRLIPFML